MESLNNMNFFEKDLSYLIDKHRTAIIHEKITRDKNNESSTVPMLISHSFESPLPYCATYVWKLASMRQCSKVSEEEEKKMTKLSFEWQKSLLSGLAISNNYRTYELRYSNFNFDNENKKEVEILLIGHLHAETLDEVKEEGINICDDFSSLLINGIEYYQFVPVYDQNKIFKIAFCENFSYGKEIQRQCDMLSVSQNKRNKLGFNANFEKDEESKLLFIPQTLNSDIHNIQNFTMFMAQSRANISVRVLFSPCTLNSLEEEKIDFILDAFERGENIKVPSKRLHNDDAKREEYKKRVENIMDESSFMTKVICASSEPITQTTVNVIADNLFGKMGSRLHTRNLEKDELNTLSSSSYPFPINKERFEFFSNIGELARLFRLPVPTENCPGVKETKLAS